MALLFPTRRNLPLPLMAAVSQLHARLAAVALCEPEDAQMTGMTRSLDRRLLALNVGPEPCGLVHLSDLRVA